MRADDPIWGLRRVLKPRAVIISGPGDCEELSPQYRFLNLNFFLTAFMYYNCIQEKYRYSKKKFYADSLVKNHSYS